jgi:hypothetical protein
MKVFVVIRIDFEGDSIKKIFASRTKAREYTDEKNKITDAEWLMYEMEVE